MINPNDIINYKRTQDELEEFWLFCILVAGKTAKTQAKVLDRLLGGDNKKPFNKIKRMIKNNELVDRLKTAGAGQYTRLSRSLNETVDAKDIDWTKVSVERLEEIHGVGPKTSRFFVMFSRKTNKYAVLDTHMLKYLGTKGYDVPKLTPSGNKYLELEQAFIAEAKKSGKSVAEFDLAIWKIYSKK